MTATLRVNRVDGVFQGVSLIIAFGQELGFVYTGENTRRNRVVLKYLVCSELVVLFDLYVLNIQAHLK